MEFIEELLVKDPRCVLDILYKQRVIKRANRIWMELSVVFPPALLPFEANRLMMLVCIIY